MTFTVFEESDARVSSLGKREKASMTIRDRLARQLALSTPKSCSPAAYRRFAPTNSCLHKKRLDRFFLLRVLLSNVI
jgi:hypothetical protein